MNMRQMRGPEITVEEPIPLWLVLLLLKAERVQSPKVESAAERLAARKVRKRLKEMPGWAVIASGLGLHRAWSFVQAADAADYAFVVQAANRQEFPADIFVAGHRVVVALRGRVGQGALGAVNDNLLDFAASLG